MVENLDVDVLAGIPFREINDIAVRPAKREIIIGEGQTYRYGSTTNLSSPTAAHRAFVLRAPAPSTTIWPGDFLKMQLPVKPHLMTSMRLSLASTHLTHVA